MPGPDLSSYGVPASAKAPAARPADLSGYGTPVAAKQQRPKRSALERMKDDAADAWKRGAIAMLDRKITRADGSIDWFGEEAGGPVQIAEGGLADRVLDAIGFEKTRHTGMSPNDRKERARREAFEQTSAADPWYKADGGALSKVGHGGAALTGAFGGSAIAPENWLNPGGGMIRKAIGQGAANAGLDALEQGVSVTSGIQDEYHPEQTLAAGATGAGLSVLGDVAAPHLARAGAAARDAVAPVAREAKAAARRMVPKKKAAVPVDLSGFGEPVARPEERETPAHIEADGLTPDHLRSQAERGVDLAPEVAGRPASAGRGAIIQESAPLHGEFVDDMPSGVASGDLWRLSPERLERLLSDAKASDNEKLVRALGEEGAAEFKRLDRARNSSMPERADAASREFDAKFGNLTPEQERLVYGIGEIDATPDDIDAVLRAHHDITPDDPEDWAAYMAAVGARRVSPDDLKAVEAGRGSAEAQAAYVRLQAAHDFFASKGIPASELPRRMADGLVRQAGWRPEQAAEIIGGFVEGMTKGRKAPAAEVRAIEDGHARATDAPDLSAYGAPLKVQPDVPHPAEPGRFLPADSGARPIMPPKLGARAGVPRGVPMTPEAAARAAEAMHAGRGVPQRATAPRLGMVDLSAYGEAAARAAGRPTGLREAPRPGAVPKADAPAYHGATVKQLAERLRQSLGVPARQGRMTLKGGALGEYDPKTGVVRTRATQELDVLSHELAHALEFKKLPALTSALDAHAADLKKLAYPGADKAHLREEGFAEFGRWYVTNPDHARRIAPAFFDSFEQALGQDAPHILSDLQGVQSAYRNLLMSASVDVAAGSMAYTGRKGPLGTLMGELEANGLADTAMRIADDAYTSFVDDLHPIARAVRELQKIATGNTGTKPDLTAAKNPYALARLARDAYAAGQVDLMHGVVPYRSVDPEGPSLADALAKALGEKMYGAWPKEDLARFDAYLIARRMVHEWDRYARGELPNPPDRNLKEFHEQVIADSEAANPTWDDAAGTVYEWVNNLWRKEYEAGFITQKAYEAGLNNHADYVPLMRDMSDKGNGSGRRAAVRGAMQYAGGVKAFEGSTRDVLSPLSTMMRRSYELNALVKRNEVFKALDDLAEAAGPGSGAIVERLPAKEMHGVDVDALEALRRAAEESNLSERDVTTLVGAAESMLDGQSETTLWRQRNMEPKPGEAIVFVWRNGEKVPLLLADGKFGVDLYTALSGMTKDLRNVVVDAMAGATQLLRYGVTLSPEFMSRNFVRDQLATWITTDVGFKPVITALRGLKSELAQDPLAIRYQQAGGMKGGANVAATKRPFPQTDAEALKQLQHLRRKGYRVKRFASWRGLAELTDLSESSTRLGVANLAFKRAKKRGLNDYEAMTEAAYTARDYLDFGRRGSRMLTAARIVTFLNAALQGLDKTVRVLSGGGNLRMVLAPLGKGKPKNATEARALVHAYKAWAKVSALGALGLGLRMLYADDPEYEEINDRLRATHWIFKKEGTWVFVPKPFELATLSNIFERAYEAGALKDPTAPKRLMSDFANTIAPPHEIPALSIPFAVANNRDHLGRPIVPDHLRGTVDPREQFNSYTSALGKMVGQNLDVSPAVVDYVITGFGGSLGKYALQGSDLANEAVTGAPSMSVGAEDMFLSRGFVRRVDRGSTSQEAFWDRMSKTGGDFTEAANTASMLARDARDEDLAAYLAKLKPDERSYAMAHLLGSRARSVHPLHRAQESVRVLSELRRENKADQLVGPDLQRITLTPSQRREVDDALAELAMIEMRNGLIAARAEGWAQKEYMRPSEVFARLHAVAAPLPAMVKARWAEENVVPAGVAARSWETLEPRLSQVDPVALARRNRTDDRSGRRQEARRIVTAPPKRPQMRAAGR